MTRLIGTAQTFMDAIDRRVMRYVRLDAFAFTKAVDALCAEAAPAPDETIGDSLIRLAKLGSVDAVAALIAGRASQDVALKAALAVARRSPDLIDDLILTSLVEMAEERFEQEVAAGRMTVTEDPYTGEKIYSVIKPVSKRSEGDSP